MEHGPALDSASAATSPPTRVGPPECPPLTQVKAEVAQGAPQAKRRRASPPLKVKMSFQRREGREEVEPLDDTIPEVSLQW